MQWNKTKTIFQENFLEIKAKLEPTYWKDRLTLPGKVNTEWLTRCILVDLLELMKKWEKNPLSTLALIKERKSNLLSDFPVVKLYTRRKWSNIFKVLKERKFKP